MQLVHVLNSYSLLSMPLLPMMFLSCPLDFASFLLILARLVFIFSFCPSLYPCPSIPLETLIDIVVTDRSMGFDDS